MPKRKRRDDDLMADQPLGTTRRWEAEPLFPDLFPEQRQSITITKPPPHVKLKTANGRDLADAGMASAWDNTPANWRTVAMTLLMQLCQNNREVTTDDLWAVLPPLPAGSHVNVIGALWAEARRQKMIERTERMINTTRSNGHARRVPVYRSLVFRC